MLIYKGNLHKKNVAISQLGAEKITFPPKPDGQTYLQTDRWTDISVYIVASLLKTKNEKLFAKVISFVGEVRV